MHFRTFIPNYNPVHLTSKRFKLHFHIRTFCTFCNLLPAERETAIRANPAFKRFLQFKTSKALFITEKKRLNK